MRGRTVLRGVRWGAWDPSLLRGLALAALFLAGALGGHLYAAGCGEASQAALGRYLNDYCGLYDAGGVAVSRAAARRPISVMRRRCFCWGSPRWGRR